jgi:hypothetical protein
MFSGTAVAAGGEDKMSGKPISSRRAALSATLVTAAAPKRSAPAMRPRFAPYELQCMDGAPGHGGLPTAHAAVLSHNLILRFNAFLSNIAHMDAPPLCLIFLFPFGLHRLVGRLRNNYTNRPKCPLLGALARQRGSIWSRASPTIPLI